MWAEARYFLMLVPWLESQGNYRFYKGMSLEIIYHGLKAAAIQ